MEKKGWSLIFIGLCLALVFSVSSVEAQDDPCDKDGDNWVKNTRRCVPRLGEGFDGIDCNDNNRELTDNCGDSGGGTVVICHFKNILKHCEDPNKLGTFLGGGLQTISNDDATRLRHEGHGDCFDVDVDFNVNPDFCGHHCIALPVGRVTCADN